MSRLARARRAFRCDAPARCVAPIPREAAVVVAHSPGQQRTERGVAVGVHYLLRGGVHHQAHAAQAIGSQDLHLPSEQVGAGQEGVQVRRTCEVRRTYPR
ncbi:MAG: hypothetical protein QHJ74_09695 [Anaerolineae bacterium]|nr:hypothetical protein [Anaerolineae bacterium]